MGGKSKARPKAEEQPASGGITPYITDQQVAFQPHFPGGMEALASQLQMGFGGQGQTPFMNNLYSPMTLKKPFQAGK